MRILSEADTRELLTVAASNDAIESSFAEYGRAGEVLANPSAAVMFVPHDPPSIFIDKMGMLPESNIAGIRFGMQFGCYYCILSDTRTGKAFGMVDVTWLYRRRVGSTGAVTAKYLARKDSKRIALIGAGQLNEEIYLTMADVFPDAEFRIASRTLEGAQAFADKLSSNQRPPLTAVDGTEACVKDADIVCTITLAQEPMIKPGMLKKGALMLSMGGVPEVAFECLDEFGYIVVDDLDYALLRGDLATWVNDGRLTQDELLARIDGNIGEVVAGKKRARENDEEIILGVIQGMVHCDLAAAKFCLDEAEKRGMGTVAEGIAASAGRDPAKGAKSASFVTDGLKRSRGMG
jgi:alanine dehydrogenase